MTVETQLKSEAATRFDAGKPRYDLIPPEAIDELAKVYAAGALKYADRNWEKGMSWGRCFGSLMRHAWKFWLGESHDSDIGGTGCHHMAMVAWNAFALFTYHSRGIGADDRAEVANESSAEPAEAAPPAPGKRPDPFVRKRIKLDDASAVKWSAMYDAVASAAAPFMGKNSLPVHVDLLYSTPFGSASADAVLATFPLSKDRPEVHHAFISTAEGPAHEVSWRRAGK